MDAARFADDYLPEDPPLTAARQRAAEVGLDSVSPAEGRLLLLLAASTAGRAAVEVGTGTGVTGLYLLRGLRPEATLTSIDPEAEHLRLARATFADAAIPPARTRLITGAAADVLPRLTDAAYDLVHLAGAVPDLAEALDDAARLLREGGMLLVTGVLGHGRVPDPAARDAASVALRGCLQAVREDPRWAPALVPVGGGVLAACRQP